MGIGSAEDLVSSEFRANQLTDNVTVGEADNQAVLGRVVLVLGLGDEALAGVVVWVVGQSGVACCSVAQAYRSFLSVCACIWSESGRSMESS